MAQYERKERETWRDSGIVRVWYEYRFTVQSCHRSFRGTIWGQLNEVAWQLMMTVVMKWHSVTTVPYSYEYSYSYM